jgi:hypothetical protein
VRPLEQISPTGDPRDLSMVGTSDGDDDLPSSVSRFDVANSLRGLAQRVGAVDDRCDLAGFDELRESDQVLLARFCDERAKVLGSRTVTA